MFKGLKKPKAQVSSEYALILAVVMGVAVSMTIFVKRAVQARVKVANDKVYAVTRTVHLLSGGVGNVLYEYEPYYQVTNREIARNETSEIRLSSGGSMGRFNKVVNAAYDIDGISEQLPPRDAD